MRVELINQIAMSLTTDMHTQSGVTKKTFIS